jgi:hypothetical protein
MVYPHLPNRRDLAVGFFKVAAIFYFTLAVVVGITHYATAPPSGANQIGQSIGAGLIWPWLIVEFVIEEG